MSESILNALMHLFAIIANVQGDKVSGKGRGIVSDFLNQHLTGELVSEYLKLFDNYLDFYHRDMPPAEKDSLDVKQVTRICRKINQELLQYERVIVFLRLLEFVNEDEHISKKEYQFIDIVADTFSISEPEAENCRQLIFHPDEKHIKKDRLLILEDPSGVVTEDLEGAWVERNRPAELRNRQRIQIENIGGKLIILYLPDIQGFVFRYFGVNSLSLDSNPIRPGVLYVLEHGSIIRGNEMQPVYYSDIAGHFLHSRIKTLIILNGHNVEFHFGRGQSGLQPFSFSEESGQLIGIMGGSGVGKSTLLNVLSGQLPLSGGKISINNYDLHADKFKLQGIIGYVPQDDLLFEELSVYQNLYYNAKLCFSNFSENDIREIVFRMLNDLELADIMNLKVGNPLDKVISGGQRKRLNIALELMRQPHILFVDEPTSGLSSMDSENVINLLKEQSTKGKLVIVNIHQPSSDIFKMFDKLWVLDRGGYPVYSGNPVEAVVYFKTLSTQANAAQSECSVCGNVDSEVILKIIEARKVDEQGHATRERKTSPKEWYKLYKENIESRLDFKQSKKLLPLSSFRVPEIDKQFRIFSIRNLKARLSNRQYILINLLEAPLLAAILAYFSKYTDQQYTFANNINLPQYLFMSVIVALFLGLTVSAEEIFKDRKILRRETFLNLSWFSYLNSKIVFLFALSAIQTFLYVIVGDLILDIRGMMPVYWLILFSTACFANMVGLNISSAFNSVVTIYILVPLILVPQLLLSGVIVSFDNLNRNLTNEKYVPFAGDMMVSRWAYEALAVEQFKNNRFEKNFYDLDRQISEASYKTSFLLPRLQNLLDESLRNLGKDDDSEINLQTLAIIQNSFLSIAKDTLVFPFEYVNDLTITSFSPEIAQEASDYITYLKISYFKLSDQANQEKDRIYTDLVDRQGGEKVQQLRENYYNDRLADVVTDRNSLKKIIQVGDELVRKMEPVFNYPDNNYGRAQFYAPVKKFNNQYFDTLWFNVIAIWLITFVFYALLLLDILKKTVRYFENIKLRKEAIKSI